MRVRLQTGVFRPKLAFRFGSAGAIFPLFPVFAGNSNRDELCRDCVVHHPRAKRDVSGRSPGTCVCAMSLLLEPRLIRVRLASNLAFNATGARELNGVSW